MRISISAELSLCPYFTLLDLRLSKIAMMSMPRCRPDVARAREGFVAVFYQKA
jgi:hypothetical protein